MLRKSAGESGISTMIVTLLALIVFVVIIILQLDATSALSRKNTVVHVCDTYLEMMMADGCLTSDNEDMLRDELEAIGCYNIDFSGTTFTEAAYQEKVCLKVTYSIDLNLHTFNGLNDTGETSGTKTSVYQRYTTCYK